MGSSVGVHPLIVIFALLAGAQIGGIVGIIAALPLLAMLRHTLQFYQFERSKAPWAMDDGIALIPARSGAPPPRRVPPVPVRRPPPAPGDASGAGQPSTAPPRPEPSGRPRAAPTARSETGPRFVARWRILLQSRVAGVGSPESGD